MLLYCLNSGGKPSTTQLMGYNITSGAFTDYGQSYLSDLGNPDGDDGYGGYFSQLDETLFTISMDGDYIHTVCVTFNLA